MSALPASEERPALDEAGPEMLTLQAVDGYRLNGFLWRDPRSGRALRPVVIINPATAVRCRYYFRFARFLFANGFDVVAYDYRGIGESRPARLRGFQAGWVDWGELDFEAVLRHVAEILPGRPIDVVAHSIGGFVTGLAASAPRLRRIVTMGAQYAYWRDYAPATRLRMLAKWHVAMPALAALCGYFPGKRLGWLEDTPRGVVRDWAFSPARFETRQRDGQRLVERMAAIEAPILALSLTDDPFGTVPAIVRLLGYFTASPRTHLRIAPAEVGVPEIGHFRLFSTAASSRACGRSRWPGSDRAACPTARRAASSVRAIFV
ncbi:MAG: alpha/beta fold hydrolase [Aliidongia sp.]